MNLFRSMIINPVRACMLRCDNCLVCHWLEKGDEKTMTMGQVEELCRCIKDSGYHFYQADVTGGDPSLWAHLPECLKMLKQSKLFDRVITYTNLMWYGEDTKDRLLNIANAADLLLVSQYPVNKRMVDSVKSLYLKNVEFLDTYRFFREPPSIIPKTIPAQCDCPGPSFYSNNKIFACNSIRPIEYKLGLQQHCLQGLWTGLGVGFMERLDWTKLQSFIGCGCCVANKKVQKAVGLVPHTTKSVNNHAGVL